jgi:thiol:disulfide interchange protein
MRFKLIIVLVVGFLAFQWVRNVRTQKMPATSTAAVVWTTDAPAALAKARSENKMVLMDFTGSDWCGWCVKLDEEVFSTAEFATYAHKNLVLLKLDFPRSKKLDASEVKQNESLARKYGINGYPTIVVLKPDGTEKGRLGYRPGGPELWLNALDELR